MSPIGSEEFRDLIGRFASGVTVVTTIRDGTPYGTTASAVTSVSLTPPMLLVCMNKISLTGQAIKSSRHFVVNVLAEDQGFLADHFATKGSNFTNINITTGALGAPLLTGALATFECRVVNDVPAGTHAVLIGLVEHASGRHGMPLAYFRGRQGKLSDLAACG